jgi:hypothetical protein
LEVWLPRIHSSSSNERMPDIPLAPPLIVPKPSLPPTPKTGPHRSRLWWLAALVVFLALSNAAHFPTLARIDPPGPDTLLQMVIGVEQGSIFAQMLVLSFFAVLGPGRSLLRQGVVWLVAVALTASLTAGIAIASMMIHVGGVGSMLVSLFAVPAILCACQTPLWGLRYFARWRTATSDGPDQDLGQISIRGMQKHEIEQEKFLKQIIDSKTDPPDLPSPPLALPTSQAPAPIPPKP